VYERVGNLLFRSDKARATQHVTDKLGAAAAQLSRASGDAARQ
jgi:hypothetical protein